ncbi:MAG: NAD-dependent epimerase/dehydratase family protein [Candidatus Aminicenantes bacterium]|jgi:dihydroflavonol-4-reductase
MRVFVTGASGFIGSHLVRELLSKKWSVRILVHERRTPDERGCEIVKGDIGDEHLLEEALKDSDALIHMAAALGGSLINRNEFLRVNVLGTKKILQAAFKTGVKRVIHFSSAGVLGAVKNNETADESYPARPISVYDLTKLEGEQIALQAAEEGAEVTIIRPGWVYGPGDRRTFKLIKAIARKRFILVTRGKACQTPVFIDDLIRGAILCMEKGKRGGIYNIAGQETLPVKTIAETIAVATGVSIPRFHLPLFPVKAAAWSLEKAFRLLKKEAPLTRGKLAFFIHPKPLSIQKASRELGYAPQTDFQKGIAQTVQWYRQHHWL